jgi:hypothetical protein
MDSSNQKYQEWEIVYTSYVIPAKQGDMNEEFGLRVNKPFHIVTKLKSGRYLDLIKNQIVIKTPNGYKTQEWYFDGKTRTIRSSKNKFSFDITGAGQADNMQVYQTNSRWW